MSEISKSPDRHSFQKEGYAKRMAEKGEPVSEDYLDYFQKIIEESNHKFDEPESRKNNMEYDLVTTDWILEKVRAPMPMHRISMRPCATMASPKWM
jgi:hypothetical protein